MLPSGIQASRWVESSGTLAPSPMLCIARAKPVPAVLPREGGICSSRERASSGSRQDRRQAEGGVVHRHPGEEPVARPEHVPAADLKRVDPQAIRQHVHQAFDGEVRLRAAETAHRSRVWAVGVDHPRFDARVGNAVSAAQQLGQQAAHRRTQGSISAGIQGRLGFQGDQAAVPARSNPVRQARRMALGVGQERFAAGVGDADCAAGCPGAQSGQDGDLEFSFPPKAPPIAAALTWTHAAGMPSTAAMWRWSSKGCCELTQTVRVPSAW